MLSEIAEKIINRLSDKGLSDRRFAAARGGLTTPDISVFTETGSFKRLGQTTIKWIVDAHVLLRFTEVSEESRRREGIQKILEAAIQILSFNDLGLKIDPLEPVKFGNVTTAEEHKARKLVYQVLYRTSFTQEKLSDEVLTDLLSIGIKYFLQEPADDGVEDFADEIT
jgi:hypothetical protein